MDSAETSWTRELKWVGCIEEGSCEFVHETRTSSCLSVHIDPRGPRGYICVRKNPDREPHGTHPVVVVEAGKTYHLHYRWGPTGEDLTAKERGPLPKVDSELVDCPEGLAPTC